VCALALLPRGGGVSELRAETLLERSITATIQSAPHSRLRFRTRSGSFVRSRARRGLGAGGGEEVAIRSHFEAAHYDWQDPLNAKAYSSWRHSLGHFTDAVSTNRNLVTREAKNYVIETRTEEGSMREASLTLEASDLAPVSGIFLFADQEWVEITPVSD